MYQVEQIEINTISRVAPPCERSSQTSQEIEQGIIPSPTCHSSGSETPDRVQKAPTTEQLTPQTPPKKVVLPVGKGKEVPTVPQNGGVKGMGKVSKVVSGKRGSGQQKMVRETIKEGMKQSGMSVQTLKDSGMSTESEVFQATASEEGLPVCESDLSVRLTTSVDSTSAHSSKQQMSRSIPETITCHTGAVHTLEQSTKQEQSTKLHSDKESLSGELYQHTEDESSQSTYKQTNSLDTSDQEEESSKSEESDCGKYQFQSQLD